ncbi:MAG: ParB/RepB/Spo0J family partition protein [Nitrospira sp.]|nr:ParB/RepB/Spo0J family partition protein [Nitrospira sp.]
MPKPRAVAQQKKERILLDLADLDEGPTSRQATRSAGVGLIGRPMDIPLHEIEEDPNQPRKEFAEESLADLAESIRHHGMKTPISVRPHPTGAKTWMVNFGARRLRASALAGKTTIPAFVDHHHTDYQQVIENVQRDNLKPRELALFIKKKLDEGERHVQIAALLGVDRSTITHHLALIEPPSCLEELYSSGRCQSAKILYDLRSLHKQFPQAVERFCQQVAEVTRSHVADLAAKLKRLPSKKAPIVIAEGVAMEEGSREARPPKILSSPAMRNGHREGGEGAIPTSPVPHDVVIVYRGKQGRLDLFATPAIATNAIIEFADGTRAEVAAKDCLIEQLGFNT